VRVLALADQPPRGDLLAWVEGNAPDAIVCCGDLDLAWLEGLRDLPLPKLGVYGNHDEPYMPELGIVDLHLRSERVGEATFSGFEGCVRYRPGPHQYTQEEASRLVTRLPAADVLVCHAPPIGVNDDPDDPVHTGFVALRDWVAANAPRLLLHGHTHPLPGRVVRTLGTTRVVHVQGARVVEL
jgi:uncharacterized protein